MKEKPVSVSYTDLIKCYPELTNDALSLKVDLTRLKENIDLKFVTSQSLLRYRQVILKDVTGGQQRLKLSAKAQKKGKYNYQLEIGKLDSKGAATPIELPQSHRINPSQKDLDQYFLNQEVLEDERSYHDTKLNGLSLSYKRNFDKVFELELADSRLHKKLFCEDKKELGTVCTCFKK